MGKKAEQKEQFSKRLARFGAVAWGVFLSLVIVLVYFRPETAVACIYLVLVVTVNKMLDTWAYTRNSTYEKGLLAMLEKTKMEMTIKGIGSNTARTRDVSEKGEEQDNCEEGGNG